MNGNVQNFGILTNGAFSVCYQRGTGLGGGGSFDMEFHVEEEIRPILNIKRVDYDFEEAMVPHINILKVTQEE